jgi:hypothetical protein
MYGGLSVAALSKIEDRDRRIEGGSSMADCVQNRETEPCAGHTYDRLSYLLPTQRSFSGMGMAS